MVNELIERIKTRNPKNLRCVSDLHAKYQLVSFQNKNGEGVVAKIRSAQCNIDIKCGNDKLMKNIDAGEKIH